MPAPTFNIDAYGLSNHMATSAQSCWVGAGATRCMIGGTDYTNGVGVLGKCILFYSGGVYRWNRCLGQGFEAVGAGTNNVWTGSGWTNGPGTNYWTTFATATTSGFTGGFYHATYNTLGTVKSINIDMDSPHDVMGMPGQTEIGTLTFDVEGVVTSINIDGQFYESTATTMDSNLSVLEGLLTGNQYIYPPSCFWWDVQKTDTTCPKTWLVSVKKFNFSRTEKDVSKVDYKLQLVVRAMSV